MIENLQSTIQTPQTNKQSQSNTKTFIYMIFEREIGGYFCIRAEKRWDIYMHTGWGKSYFTTQNAFIIFFFHVF